MPGFLAKTEHAMARCTVRIEAWPNCNEFTSIGTGFFYKISHPTTELTRIFILTNKHVIKECEFVSFVLSSAHSISNLNEEHQPINRIDDTIVMSLENKLLMHPDPAIDLCAIDVTIPLGNILVSKNQLRLMTLDFSWLLQPVDRENLTDVEPLLVIGYPSGLWDSYNNMPIIRRGTTATHALAKYDGKNQFLVDVSAYQGSSGSPVFRYESPMYRMHDGTYSFGTKVNLIGIVWGVIEQLSNGTLYPIEVPSKKQRPPIFQSSLNLALALQSDTILAIDEIVFPGIVEWRSKNITT